jgi:hypothetical protein
VAAAFSALEKSFANPFGSCVGSWTAVQLLEARPERLHLRGHLRRRPALRYHRLPGFQPLALIKRHGGPQRQRGQQDLGVGGGGRRQRLRLGLAAARVTGQADEILVPGALRRGVDVTAAVREANLVLVAGPQ